MDLLFLSGVALGGGKDALPGEVHPVADPVQAAHLIRRGKAIPHDPEGDGESDPGKAKKKK